MTFLKNIWYVAAWGHELGFEQPIGRVIIDEPVALYRKRDGAVVAMEDRCPHRHAPLSFGRIEGDDLRCMYHGIKFGCDGVCKEIPGTDAVPQHSRARTFPVFEKWDWIWVWMGNPERADIALIPDAFGLASDQWVAKSGSIDYAANYELINDNLCDLSHLDFVHETTLGAATCRKWAGDSPKISTLDNGVLFERWFLDHQHSCASDLKVDTWSSIRYLLPGLFLAITKSFPAGTARSSDFIVPNEEPLFLDIEQQAVTPISEARTQYYFASGVGLPDATRSALGDRLALVNSAFAEDKCMIEAQQKIWERTPTDRQKAFIPQDKGLAIFRRLLASRIAGEQVLSD